MTPTTVHAHVLIVLMLRRVPGLPPTPPTTFLFGTLASWPHLGNVAEPPAECVPASRAVHASCALIGPYVSSIRVFTLCISAATPTFAVPTGRTWGYRLTVTVLAVAGGCGHVLSHATRMQSLRSLPPDVPITCLFSYSSSSPLRITSHYLYCTATNRHSPPSAGTLRALCVRSLFDAQRSKRRGRTSRRVLRKFEFKWGLARWGWRRIRNAQVGIKGGARGDVEREGQEGEEEDRAIQAR
ncbi:hypothetical protein C8F04DRAFT_1332364 [Mycena alexandri]|uniref:Uncharacterized protein n=1 Tax=Mycena alexandri TaxID=1745969 RepID=A0AAD6S0M1_9AGAR|nr:hypothetical protein C8F04DRAFT_1332364 [Mycena alexandri]